MTTFITIPVDRRELISQAVNETIIHFRGTLPQEEESLCLYYAGLTADLCSCIINTLYGDFFYVMNCGKFSICTNVDSSNSNQAVNFGATGISPNQGKYHCWVVGVYDQNGYVTQASEFIDLTSRFYSINAKKQGWTWDRDDISDYLWLQENELEKLRISASSDDQATQEANKQWKEVNVNQKFSEVAINKYLDLRELVGK